MPRHIQPVARGDSPNEAEFSMGSCCSNKEIRKTMTAFQSEGGSRFPAEEGEKGNPRISPTKGLEEDLEKSQSGRDRQYGEGTSCIGKRRV